MNIKKMALFSICGILALGVYIGFFKQRTWNGRIVPDPIPTLTLVDGSTEHTLIDWIFRDKEYFEHLVLKLPPSAQYWKPDELSKSGPAIVNGTKLGPTKTYNRSLTLYLKMPDLKFAKLKQEEHDKSEISVSIQHSHKYLGIENIAGEKKPFGFTGSYIRSYGVNCGLGEEIDTGFFILRDITEVERQAYDIGRYRHVFEEYCGYSGMKNYFVYFQPEDTPVAYGECQKPGALKDKHRNICRFQIWLPQRRVAYIYFDALHIDNLPNIYKGITRKINDATVIEKSTNLKWRPVS
ncbi:MAG: hypothetical protein GY750_16950 [Lentisphaerae bacterium]|nr:hypothetical protein [Lentisphaerota bacterium]